MVSTDPELAIRPVDRTSVADAVHDQLRSAILCGHEPPGSLLPSELDLAAQAGVNRQAVREALQRLRQVGLVEIVHGGGARVLDWRVNGTLSLLGEAMFPPDMPIDAKVVGSMFRLRFVTLVDASRLAAERRPDGLAERLHALATRMHEESADPLPARGEFWDEIVRASGNVAYRLVFNTQYSMLAKVPSALLMQLVQGPEIDARYAELAAAVERGDADATATAAAAILEPSVRAFEEHP